MRIARTLEARVAALEGDSASDDVAIDWDLSGLSETDLERLREAVSVFRADGASALTDEQLHLLIDTQKTARERKQ